MAMMCKLFFFIFLSTVGDELLIFFTSKKVHFRALIYLFLSTDVKIDNEKWLWQVGAVLILDRKAMVSG